MWHTDSMHDQILIVKWILREGQKSSLLGSHVTTITQIYANTPTYFDLVVSNSEMQHQTIYLIHKYDIDVVYG